MRRISTDGWAGLVMLTVSAAVAAPVLIGVAAPTIPRGWWIVLFAIFLVALLGATVSDRSMVFRRISYAVSVVSVWAIVLTAPGMGLLSILLVVTAATSVYLVRLWVGFVVVALNTAVVALTTAMTAPDLTQSIIVTGFYLLIQTASLLSSAALIKEQRMRQELAATHVDLQAASILLSESARTAERLRISRELHDLIGHQLTVLTLELETARHVDSDASRAHLDRADRVARDLLRDVRTTVGEMRSQPPDLERAMRAMVDALPGLAVSIEVSPRVQVDEQQSAALVRATQEIVTNTLRHAEARELWIEVAAEPDGILLRARDDGRGAREVKFGSGLLGLSERFAELGGDISVDGSRGFRITARVPVP